MVSNQRDMFKYSLEVAASQHELSNLVIPQQLLPHIFCKYYKIIDTETFYICISSTDAKRYFVDKLDDVEQLDEGVQLDDGGPLACDVCQLYDGGHLDGKMHSWTVIVNGYDG